MDEPHYLISRRLTSPESPSLQTARQHRGQDLDPDGDSKTSGGGGNKRWNQFKMLMLLPNITSSKNKQSPSSNKMLEKPPIPGRKRSNSAISLLFGVGHAQSPTGNLAALQHPYSTLVTQQSIDTNSSESSFKQNSNNNNEIDEIFQRRNSSPMGDPDQNQMMVQSMMAAVPLTPPSPATPTLTPSSGNNSRQLPVAPMIVRSMERRASEDGARQFLRLELTLAEFKTTLSTLKSHLREPSYSRSQLEYDANDLLISLHRILTACPEIANATDVHTLASQLMRLSSLLPSPRSSGVGNNSSSVDNSNSSSDTSNRRSPSPSGSSAIVAADQLQSAITTVHSIASSAVVSPHLRADVLRCVDGLAVLLVRRLSRYISTSILAELKDQVIDEELQQIQSIDVNNNKKQFGGAPDSASLISSASRYQPGERSNTSYISNSRYRRTGGGAGVVSQTASNNRLARSMTDVSASYTASTGADSSMATSSNNNNNSESVINPVLNQAVTFSAAQQDVLLGVPPFSIATPGEELDLIVARLCRSDGSVEALLEQLRLTDRYLKDIANYVEKRTLFYLDYIKSLNKLANNIKPTLSGTPAASPTAPLQYIFLPFVQHDVEYTSLALRSSQAQLSERDGFVSIVSERRAELKRSEKTTQERWTRVVGLYVAAMSDMRKAHQQYERAVDALSKRRDEESLAKEADAQIQLRTKIMEVNHKLNQLEKTKSDCLYEIIRQIGITETTLKESSEKYFHFLSVVICEHPSVYEAMRSQSRCVEVGSQFMAEVRRIITESNHFIFEPIEFEQLRKSVKAQNESGGTSVLASSISSMIPLPRAFRVPLTVITSFDSEEDSPSRSSSPTPPDAQESFVSTDAPSSSSVTTASGCAVSNRRRKTRQESLTSNHCLSRLRTSSARCAICRAATVYEQGVKCDKCGLVFHRKCVDSSSTLCDSRRRSPIFGIDLATHLADTGQTVPLVLQKCITSIERDALSVKGIYRVPGSKKQIEAVCRALEEGSGNSVNLDEEQPHVLTGIVKSYLLQLPEPLFTNKLAGALLRSSREDRLTIDELQIAVKRLPEANYVTCGLILQHLKIVATRADENQMTISNLAIIFGPTLLLSVLRGQTSASGASATAAVEPSEMWSTSMIDTVHASKVVEKLLINFEVIFDNLPLFLTDLRRAMSNGDATVAAAVAINTETSPIRSLGKTPPIDSEIISSSPSSRQVNLQSSLVAGGAGDEMVPACYPSSSSPTSSKQSSPGPQNNSNNNTATISNVATADLPPATLTTILPFRPIQSSSSTITPQQVPAPPLLLPQTQPQAPVYLAQSDVISTSTDTSIQSASLSSVATPIGKKTSNVIVRL